MLSTRNVLTTEQLRNSCVVQRKSDLGVGDASVATQHCCADARAKARLRPHKQTLRGSQRNWFLRCQCAQAYLSRVAVGQKKKGAAGLIAITEKPRPTCLKKNIQHSCSKSRWARFKQHSHRKHFSKFHYDNLSHVRYNTSADIAQRRTSSAAEQAGRKLRIIRFQKPLLLRRKHSNCAP